MLFPTGKQHGVGWPIFSDNLWLPLFNTEMPKQVLNTFDSSTFKATVTKTHRPQKTNRLISSPCTYPPQLSSLSHFSYCTSVGKKLSAAAAPVATTPTAGSSRFSPCCESARIQMLCFCSTSFRGEIRPVAVCRDRPANFFSFYFNVTRLRREDTHTCTTI